MSGKNTGVIVAVLVALAAGGWFAKSKGLLGGAPAAEQADGEGGDAAGGKRKRRKGGSGAEGGEREGAEAADAQSERQGPEDYDSPAAKYREAKSFLYRATTALEDYKVYSKWPESARPAEEMAPGGGLLPHHTEPVRMPMVKRRPDGKPDTETPPSKSRIVHVLDRFNLGPDDSVTAILHAMSEKDAELPLRCVNAKAFAGAPTVAPKEPLPPPMDLNCQKRSEDKGLSVTFVPKQSPFRAFNGGIVFEFDLEVDRDDGTKEAGMTRINVNYSPATGGKLTGAVREAYENGSVAYYLGFEAVGPGFARLNVRADQGADDKIFAHMNIRQEIEKAGPTELRAELFGKLIVDNGVTKVRLRDIDGEFIGRESGLSSPVPGKDGVFYVGKPIDKTKVKGDDWQAPEKDAKMRDLEQSVKEAQENCDKNFDGCKN